MPAGGQRHGRIVQGRLTADPRECPPPPQVLLDSYALELQWIDRTLVAVRDEIHNTEELLRCVCARARKRKRARTRAGEREQERTHVRAHVRA